MFATKKIQIFLFFYHFLNLTIHAEIIWGQTKMGAFEHFFHECKWHAHIGDVVLNILISYLYLLELVWIRYEIFKVSVKRWKGKSIRGWNELDRNEGFLNFGANQTGVTQLRAQM